MKANCLSLAIATLLALPAALPAAEPAAAAPADAPATDKTKKQEDAMSLEGITVTARRREETLQDVPIAVTALSAATLEARNVQSLNDLAGRHIGSGPLVDLVHRDDRLIIQ